MARTTNPVPSATITTYVDAASDQHSEITITGTYRGRAVNQTMLINPPCLLMVDSTNRVFMTIPISSLDPNLEFVKFIRDLT